MDRDVSRDRAAHGLGFEDDDASEKHVVRRSSRQPCPWSFPDSATAARMSTTEANEAIRKHTARKPPASSSVHY